MSKKVIVHISETYRSTSDKTLWYRSYPAHTCPVRLDPGPSVPTRILAWTDDLIASPTHRYRRVTSDIKLVYCKTCPKVAT